MAHDSAGTLYVPGMRVTLLDVAGAPLVGTETCYVTKSLIAIAAGLEYRDVKEVEQVAASGNACLFVSAPATLKQGTCSVTVCTEDPVIPWMLIGGTLINRAAIPEIHTVTIQGVPTGGTFKLTYDGEPTGNIVYNAAAAVVQTALEALPNVEPGDVTVTGAAGGPYTVTWADTQGNVVQLSGDGALLTGGSNMGVGVVTTQQGSEFTNIGYKAPRQGVTERPFGVSIEFWTEHFTDSGRASELSYGYWALPRCLLVPSGDWTHNADAATQPAFEGTTQQNSNWGAGPGGDWDTALYGEADRVWQYTRVDEIPDLSQGFVPIV